MNRSCEGLDYLARVQFDTRERVDAAKAAAHRERVEEHDGTRYVPHPIADDAPVAEGIDADLRVAVAAHVQTQQDLRPPYGGDVIQCDRLRPARVRGPVRDVLLRDRRHVCAAPRTHEQRSLT